MEILIIVGAYVIIYSLLFWMISTAPSGYEDENGFHQTDEPEFSFKATLYPDEFEDTPNYKN